MQPSLMSHINFIMIISFTSFQIKFITLQASLVLSLMSILTDQPFSSCFHKCVTNRYKAICHIHNQCILYLFNVCDLTIFSLLLWCHILHNILLFISYLYILVYFQTPQLICVIFFLSSSWILYTFSLKKSLPCKQLVVDSVALLLSEMLSEMKMWVTWWLYYLLLIQLLKLNALTLIFQPYQTVFACPIQHQLLQSNWFGVLTWQSCH